MGYCSRIPMVSLHSFAHVEKQKKTKYSLQPVSFVVIIEIELRDCPVKIIEFSDAPEQNIATMKQLCLLLCASAGLGVAARSTGNSAVPSPRPTALEPTLAPMTATHSHPTLPPSPAEGIRLDRQGVHWVDEKVTIYFLSFCFPKGSYLRFLHGVDSCNR